MAAIENFPRSLSLQMPKGFASNLQAEYEEGGDLSMVNTSKVMFDAPSSQQDIRISIPTIAATANIDSASGELNSPPNDFQLSPPLRLETDKRSLLSLQQSVSYSTTSKQTSSTYNANTINTPWYRNPRIKKNPKTIAAALSLLIIGICFFLGAIVEAVLMGSTTDRTILFIIIGILTALPGGYQTHYVYRVLRGDPGYHFSGIPSFDM